MTADPSPSAPTPAAAASGVLALADGSVFIGRGLGAEAQRVGELCFNTAMTGYQETLTDPSYAAQIICFTFPHIGNVGANLEDLEATNPAALGFVVRMDPTAPSNFRALDHLDAWAKRHGLIGVAGPDTRRLTRRIRDGGAPNAAIAHRPQGGIDVDALVADARAWPGLEGMDLAKSVSRTQRENWTETLWRRGEGFGRLETPRRHVVAYDFGAKRNMFRALASEGCAVTIVPADTAAEDVLALKPDGVFLSNGPGDPAATGAYAGPEIAKLIDSGKPIFAICLGHQLLAIALGARTFKLNHGHRGANHPVKELATGRVEITSQNHGFAVDPDSLPAGVSVTHVSLFDGTVEGIACADRPIFSVQHHPEASPGPRDAAPMFKRFVAAMDAHA
ncbi:MAG: glutamine-hydrolyzing carbamoyl-phosphate synthase small subunit [Pseudomonadota bacterium]